jgi:hypothetical protein
MGTVVQFPASPADRPCFDPEWKLSKRGNYYTRRGEFCIATFRVAGGWKWSIAGRARDPVTYSRRAYPTEHEARLAIWAMLPKAFA